MRLTLANPVGFEGASNVLHAAPGDTNTRDLPIYVDPAQIISCWRLTPEELDEVKRTGVVWLSVVNIGSYAPSYVSGNALVTVGGVPSEAEPYFEPPKKG